MKKSYDVATGILTFTADDEAKTIQTLDTNELSDAIKLQAMLHGFSQKIGDSYASAGSQDNPEAYAIEQVKETIAQLKNDAWRAAGGGGGPKFGLLVTALAEVTGQTLDEAKAFVDALGDGDEAKQKKELKELQAKPKIKLAMAKIKAKRAAAAVEAAEKAAAAEAAETTEG
jgi:hypothetical protein